ncbi:armadillo-type protein [Mycotypha africana]|uniref:armadillo-type protein n=1 Tax=Mycotypha africana TaxID=64632 RepID=UPI00230170B2|nr:armadillo-type protein [Mycotypha africana]KAI8968601.1 armadillo-type protein [Mycotypha africana]
MLLHLTTLKQSPQKLSTVDTIINNTQEPEIDIRLTSFQKCLMNIDDPTDNSKIRTFVDSNDFVQVLTACGTPSTPSRVRSLAFMVLTKLFNPSTTQKDHPMTFIIEKCAACFAQCIDQGKNESKLLAYRTLNAIFQASMTVGAAILCQEGTVEEMMDVVEFEIEPVQLAIAELLCIASSDKSCRKQILAYATNWLAKMASQTKTDTQLKAAASTALAKLKAQNDLSESDDIPTVVNRTVDPTNTGAHDQLEDAMRKMNLTDDKLIDALCETIVSNSSDVTSILNSVEGLAYSSLKPNVKEKLGSNEDFLKCLSALAVSAANDNLAINNPLLFGIGTIFANLTMYKPVLDEQQKQMKKLRDLANAKQKQAAAGVKSVYTEDAAIANDPTDDDEAVEERIKRSVKNGVAVALMVLAKSQSVNLRAIAAQTYLNLVTPQSTRGQLLQQGIVKSLLLLTRDTTIDDIGIIASQALAKLAITTDPRIAFQGGALLDLVRPFLNLCKDSKSQLRQFEGLMALTNLASVDDRVRLSIDKAGGMAIFENLQLSDHNMVQRAATEMVCNMTFCEPVFDRYSDPRKSQNKIRLLMILSDHEDPATRRAASGALAILANSKGTCEMILKVDKAYERILRWLDVEETADVQHRGIEVIRCLIEYEGGKVVKGLMGEGVDKRLITLIQKCQVPAVQSAAVEVLRMFSKNGAQITLSN